jgi:hypothetical protein
MNINPLGISAYGKADVTRKNPDAAQRAQEQFAIEAQTGATTENTDSRRVTKAEQDKPVTMAKRDAETSSSLAVKAQGEFAQMLSPEEREAIDLLFEKYTQGQKSGTSYGAKGEQNNTARLGASVDFRV